MRQEQASPERWGSWRSTGYGLQRFLAFYRRQMAFPSISKASGHAMLHCISFYSAIEITKKSAGEPVTP